MRDSILPVVAGELPAVRRRFLYAVNLLLFGLSALALACASGPKVHERNWIEVTTPNFQIMSTLSPTEAEKLAIDLERFLVIVKKFTNAMMSTSPIPTKIFAFERKGDFQRFTHSSNVAGWMRTGMRSNMIALAEFRGMDASQIIGHEYIHYILNNATSILYPTWYNEGLAEYVSTLKVRGDRELVMGTASRERVQVLNWAPWIPIRRIISTRGLDEYLDPTEVGVFYAEAWALVHYLHQGRDGKHYVSEEMDRYRNLVEAGSGDEEAFEEAFGMSPSEADRRLKTYLARDIRAVVFDLAILEFEPPNTTIRKMSTSEIASELGSVALAQDNASDAQIYFEAAITADPSNPRAHAGLGDAHKFQGRWELAEPYFESAIELGPQDALNYLDFAEYFHDKAREAAFIDDRKALLATARRNYVNSQKLDPDIPETYAMYGSTYLESGQDHSRAVKALEHANRLLPSSTDILILLAQAYALNGRENEARDLVVRYVAWSHATDREEAAAEILSNLTGEPSAEPDGSAGN